MINSPLARLCTGLVCLASAALVSASPASAAPVWNIDLHHLPTNFEPGGTGTATLATLENGSAPSTNEVQRLSIVAHTGQYRLTYAGETTGNLSFDAVAPAVRAALEALPSIAPGDVTVVGDANQAGPGTGSPFTITFTGSLAATNVPELTASQGSTPLSRLGEYWVDVTNVGPDPATSTVSVQINLPSGLTRHSIDIENAPAWTCPGGAGSSSFTCTTNATIPRHRLARSLIIRVNVAPGASGGSLCHGDRQWGRRQLAGQHDRGDHHQRHSGWLRIRSAAAGCADFYASDGLTPVREAGSHPEQATFAFDLNSRSQLRALTSLTHSG